MVDRYVSASLKIMVEVHPFPKLALSVSKQLLNLTEFEGLLGFLTNISGKE
jgi:3-deoxy-D-arabino-heptulosonate 7-phosphate (DAHP) synthase